MGTNIFKTISCQVQLLALPTPCPCPSPSPGSPRLSLHPHPSPPPPYFPLPCPALIASLPSSFPPLCQLAINPPCHCVLQDSTPAFSSCFFACPPFLFPRPGSLILADSSTFASSTTFLGPLPPPLDPLPLPLPCPPWPPPTCLVPALLSPLLFLPACLPAHLSCSGSLDGTAGEA